MKITPNQRHLLFLTRKGKRENGWTDVSDMIWPLVEGLSSELPQLVEIDKEKKLIKLTNDGEIVLDYT